MEESASREIQLSTASINNKDQNTQKEADIPGGNEKKNDELEIEIREMFDGLEIQSSTRRHIYKVPHYIRKWNKEAYTPQVISIGPFHHKNKRLKAMEEHKERFFWSFVKRSNIELEYLVGTIRGMEESIRGCYAETIDLTSDRFVKMVLMDASFILELFLRSVENFEDPLTGEPRAFAVKLDLVLLENQLPFFVIQKLYDLALPFSSYNSLLQLSFIYFDEFNIQRIEPNLNVEIEHFTDLLRTFQIPPPEKRPIRGYEVTGKLYTATELHDAGVKFVGGKSEFCFDIEFKKRVLNMARLELSDWAEVTYRNIIALEQTRYIEEGYFTDYFIFMDLLIKTTKDVDLLCNKKILFNYFDNSSAAKSMIKNLKKGILLINMRSDYFELGKELNSFYDNPRHRWIAILKREYFNTPSQATSTIVSLGIITVLTLIQTVCSIMQVTSSS